MSFSDELETSKTNFDVDLVLSATSRLVRDRPAARNPGAETSKSIQISKDESTPAESRQTDGDRAVKPPDKSKSRPSSRRLCRGSLTREILGRSVFLQKRVRQGCRRSFGGFRFAEDDFFHQNNWTLEPCLEKRRSGGRRTLSRSDEPGLYGDFIRFLLREGELPELDSSDPRRHFTSHNGFPVP